MSENSYTIEQENSRYSVRISVQTEQRLTCEGCDRPLCYHYSAQVFSVAKELPLIYHCLAIQFAHAQFSLENA